VPPAHPLAEAKKLPRSPFFQRYGVNLPSSLTEGHSFTSRDFSLPTSVGLRYGQNWVWIEAFLGGLGTDDFRTLARTRPRHHHNRQWDLPHRPTLTGSPACPFAGFTFLSASPLLS
jgi:hypothetical protein